MSKKYKEELNRIIMTEEMKKRILHNVLNENVQAKITKSREKKYSILKRNIEVIAACFTVIICLGVVKNYPEIFTQGNKNLQQQEITTDIDDENNDSQQQEKTTGVNDENNDLQNIKRDKSEDSENDNNSANDNVQKRKITNQPSSIEENFEQSVNENFEKSGTGISEDKNAMKNGYGNENSSIVKEKERDSLNSESNSSVSALNTKPESQPNYNTESRDSKKSNNVKNDTSKSQEKIIDDNGKSTDEVVNDKSISQDEVTGNCPITFRTNSAEEYKTIEEAESAVDFKINNIKVLPDKFNIDQIDVISNQIIQIEYSDGKDIINFRAGKESDDISGDYNIYEVENNLTINGESVNLKGHKDGEINLAVWKIADIEYSISSTKGIKEEKISEMIKSAVMT